MSNVQILRLDTGEEIMGEVIDEGHEYCVTKPLRLFFDYQAKQLMFFPFMPYSDANLQFSIGKNHVHFSTNPASSLIDDYNRVVGNTPNIITPDKKIIL